VFASDWSQVIAQGCPLASGEFNQVKLLVDVDRGRCRLGEKSIDEGEHDQKASEKNLCHLSSHGSDGSLTLSIYSTFEGSLGFAAKRGFLTFQTENMELSNNCKPDRVRDERGTCDSLRSRVVDGELVTELMEKHMKVFLAKPRGFCAGVDRAIDVVEIALDIYGPPVYVRHEIVHNDHVVNELKGKGAIFLDDVAQIPEGAVTIFSAHGVSPSVREQAKGRNLKVIDATCPLVTKVHLEAVRYAKKGYTIILIGHRNHVEVDGTMGEAPESMVLVEAPEDVAKLEVRNEEKMVYLTQTTLSIDDTQAVIDALKKRFPHIESPPKDDICYATTNRQAAVKEMTDKCDMILVIGSPTSSNSNRLVEVAQARGCEAYLINDSGQMNIEMFRKTKRLGITAGASAPEHLVQDVVRWLEKNSSIEFADLDVIEEDVQFTLPRELQAIREQKKAEAVAPS